MIKQLVNRIPILGPVARAIYRMFRKPTPPFSSSGQYWIGRYESGGNSGAGSYNKLREFKAEVLNAFVKDNEIAEIIEYGCGDGNQLLLANYPAYVGYDISPNAISRCRELFSEDQTKVFKLMDEYEGECAQLTLSLDVIFHLVEDNVYFEYMIRLFDSSTCFVIIYSSNMDSEQEYHVRHRAFSNWIARERPQWVLLKSIPNKYPFTGDDATGSMAEFYIYRKLLNRHLESQ